MGGWLHSLVADPKPVRQLPPPRPTIDAARMMRNWFNRTTREAYSRLAKLIGVSVESLISLKCGWAPEYHAWGWPMRNGAGAVVGIRLRAESGRKWSVTGGHEGIFFPSTEPQDTVFVPEGPTDTAALLTIGKFASGRPNNAGGISHLSATISRVRVIRRAVVIADNDPDKLLPNGKRWNPGLDGAQRLANDIGVPCCIVVLPAKDVREAVQLGMTGELLDSFVSGLVWHQPKTKPATT